jgi:hypothetical protein
MKRVAKNKWEMRQNKMKMRNVRAKNKKASREIIKVKNVKKCM